jgi:hypothetical protein
VDRVNRERVSWDISVENTQSRVAVTEARGHM